MLEFLPISNTIINSHKQELFLYYTSLNELLNNPTYSFDEYRVNYYAKIETPNTKAGQAIIEKSGFSARTWRGFRSHLENELWLHDEFICLMPISVWEKWSAWVLKKDSRARNSWTKLFLYLYLKIHNTRNGCYQHSRELIAKELEMSEKDVSAKVKEMCAAGFIIDSKYIPKVESKYYTLPQNLFSNTFKKDLT